MGRHRSGRRLPLDLRPDTPVEVARRQLAAALRDAGNAGADLDARVLVCAACGLDHAGLIRDPARPLGEHAPLLAAHAARRLAGEPVARILGRREFWGLTLRIDAAVLDPRPDTEALVGAMLDRLPDRDAPLRILDLGTGSGAILLALLSELPRAWGVGIDRSSAACRTAARNAAALGLGGRALVACGSWGEGLRGPFDVVASNPPYIATAVIHRLDREVRDHDPVLALDGGADGLDAYRAILPEAAVLLAPGGIVAVECGFDQGEAVAALMRGQGFHDVAVRRDLAGHGRAILGVAPARGDGLSQMAGGREPPGSRKALAAERKAPR